MYIVAKGTVEVVSKEGTLAETLYTTLGEGQYFGELCIIGTSIRTASVRAKSYCNLLILSKTVMDKWMHEFPEFASMLLKEIQKTVSAEESSTTYKMESKYKLNLQESLLNPNLSTPELSSKNSNRRLSLNSSTLAKRRGSRRLSQTFKASLSKESPEDVKLRQHNELLQMDEKVRRRKASLELREK